MSKPNPDTLRDCRDYLSRLLDLPPNEAIDLLANHGEGQLALFNEGLGREAFKVGDTVLAAPADKHEFSGIVVAVKADDAGVVFTVRDQEDDCFDCEAGELTPVSS